MKALRKKKNLKIKPLLYRVGFTRKNDFLNRILDEIPNPIKLHLLYFL